MEARWGLRFHGYFSTGSEAFVAEDGSAFVPRTRAALFGSDAALVLAFRGSEPTNLINLRSAGRHAQRAVGPQRSCALHWKLPVTAAKSCMQARPCAVARRVQHGPIYENFSARPHIYACRISMTERAGLGGRVHDGFYGALFHGDEEAGVLFSDLAAAIDAQQGKALYVTGGETLLHCMFACMQRRRGCAEVTGHRLCFLQTPCMHAKGRP